MTRKHRLSWMRQNQNRQPQRMRQQKKLVSKNLTKPENILMTESILRQAQSLTDFLRQILMTRMQRPFSRRLTKRKKLMPRQNHPLLRQQAPLVQVPLQNHRRPHQVKIRVPQPHPLLMQQKKHVRTSLLRQKNILMRENTLRQSHF